MVDVELVIKVPEKIYEYITSTHFYISGSRNGNSLLEEILKSIRTATKPRKGEWLRLSDLPEQEDYRYKCSCCGNVINHKSKMDLYTFNSWCGRCGSDNGRHIKYEVEE